MAVAYRFMGRAQKRSVIDPFLKACIKGVKVSVKRLSVRGHGLQEVGNAEFNGHSAKEMLCASEFGKLSGLGVYRCQIVIKPEEDDGDPTGWLIFSAKILTFKHLELG
jgi:hypothetical protein